MTNKKVRTTSKINKQKEIEQKKRKKRKIIMIAILLSSIITAICIYLLTSATFNIQEIIISGNEQLNKEEIEQLSEIKIGDNIFSTIEIVARVKLKESGYIENVKINKIYPNKIEIKVEERKKEYQVITETGCFIYIDSQGYIIDYSLEKLPVTTRTGFNITEAEIQDIKRLEEKDLVKMEKILHIKDAAEKIELVDKIEQIDTTEEYILHLDEDKIRINLGDATNLTNRMFYVKAILKEENGNSGTIYVNGNLNEGFAPYFSAN